MVSNFFHPAAYAKWRSRPAHESFVRAPEVIALQQSLHRRRLDKSVLHQVVLKQGTEREFGKFIHLDFGVNVVVGNASRLAWGTSRGQLISV